MAHFVAKELWCAVTVHVKNSILIDKLKMHKLRGEWSIYTRNSRLFCRQHTFGLMPKAHPTM